MRGGAYLTLSAVFLAGCSGSPLGYLGATSPMAGPIASLGVGLLAMSIGVCVIVAILLWIAIRLRVALWRGRQTGDLSITPGNDRATIRWIASVRQSPPSFSLERGCERWYGAADPATGFG